MFSASLGISALLHLVALFVLRFETHLVPAFVPSDPVRLRPAGMVVYDTEPVDEAAAPTPDEAQRPAPTPPELGLGPPVPIPPALLESAPPAKATPLVPSARAPSAPSSAAERVNPKMGDSRLWASFGTSNAPAHLDDAARRRITLKEWNAVVNPRLSIEEYNDSVRLAEEAAAKAVDWTLKTGPDGRWGVSPEGIHLGSLTLPIPIQFATPPGRREGAGVAQRSWSNIQAQSGAMEIPGRHQRSNQGDTGAEGSRATRLDSPRRRMNIYPRQISPGY